MQVAKYANGKYTPAEPRYADDLDDLDDFPLREGLGWKARKEADLLRTIARGVMLITEPPGSGKDLFASSLCALNKYYFGRRILLDFIPKRAFDEIDGGGKYVLFNAKVMIQEINKMAKASGVEGIETSDDPKEDRDFIKEATAEWVLGEGGILFKNAILYMHELKRYCYNRNPHARINKFISSLNSFWRHLDLLVIGTHTKAHEIDQYSYLDHVTHWAKCSWSITQRHTSDVAVRRGAFIGSSDVYNVEGMPIIFHVNGNEPRGFLGGRRFYDLYKTKAMANLRPSLTKEMLGG